MSTDSSRPHPSLAGLRVLIRGGGDLASGVAHRLFRSGFQVMLTEVAAPLAVRRSVAFCEAVWDGVKTVEGVTARRADDPAEALAILAAGEIPVLVDPAMTCRSVLEPTVIVDAILAKRNTGLDRAMAPLTIGLGPGFRAPEAVHLAIETMRGHDLGRVLYTGSALPDTSTPGVLYGHSVARLLRAPAAGIFKGINKIGDRVKAGQTVAMVEDQPVISEIDGLLRGLLMDGLSVHKGMKIGDVDPGGADSHCFTVSDKARSLGGAVLEAILHLARERGIAL